jgi:branched-chain amino acid aminotransferase
VIVWIDGVLVPSDEARVSPLDRGLTVGDGVFETVRAYDGRPFAWRRHAERLRASADGLGLAAPDDGTLRVAVAAVLDANGLTASDARIRVTVTAGAGPPGSSRGMSAPVTIVVAVPFTAATGPAHVVVAPWSRNEHGATAGLKTISYAANVRALAYAEARGANEALFANTAGNLCEATGSNVFVVGDGELRTPPPDAGCLLGVTRALLLELARSADIPAREVDVPMRDLMSADEAFLSSTTREVQPIATIDGVALARAPGPIAIALADAFRALVARDLDP